MGIFGYSLKIVECFCCMYSIREKWGFSNFFFLSSDGEERFVEGIVFGLFELF